MEVCERNSCVRGTIFINYKDIWMLLLVKNSDVKGSPIIEAIGMQLPLRKMG